MCALFRGVFFIWAHIIVGEKSNSFLVVSLVRLVQNSVKSFLRSPPFGGSFFHEVKL